MKKICLIVCSVLLLNSAFSQNQNDEVLLTIDDKKINSEEFIRIYNKNKTNFSTGEVTSIEEYLDLFINFKLKVIEAEKSGLDTTSAFVNEFEGYKKQLAAPYLIDEQANEKVIQEAYHRMQNEVRASHILIKIAPDSSPEDSLVAYEKAIGIRKRLLKGESFEMVAKGSSEDPSVKNNGGDLGYFSVFQMIYPFENAVYNSEIGEISDPVRTRFGYHIVKVTDKRKARGQVKVAHIMLTVPRGTSPEVEKQKKLLVNELYHRAKQGEDFQTLAKEYSEDRGSAGNGGELPWFGAGRMVQEFEKAAFDLSSNEEISQPVRTGFGWHILKRIDRKDVPTFEEALSEIKRKVGKDQRAKVAREALINNLKKEYGFEQNQENFPVKYDTTINTYVLKQKYLVENSDLDGELFSFLNKEFYEKDYVEYVNGKKRNKELNPYDYLMLYNEFVNNIILKVEESRLEEKYPEYRYLLKEYHDGMLLFEITDQKIWSKAASDSIALKDYYKKNKSNYMWDERWNGSIYYCSNEQAKTSVSKIINKKSFGKKITNDNLLEQLNTEEEVLRIESNIFEKGENIFVDNLIWNEKNSQEKAILILLKGEVVKPENKSFNECRGMVISDYQDYLDIEWIKSLREKYNIIINSAVLSSIK
jgi:peptidyl-prolyl cis-trans isomerase SurA